MTDQTDQVYSLTVVYREHIPSLIKEACDGDTISRLALGLLSTVMGYVAHADLMPCACCKHDMHDVREIEAIGLAIPHDHVDQSRAVVALLCGDCAQQDWTTQQDTMLDLMSVHFDNVRILHNVHTYAGHA